MWGEFVKLISTLLTSASIITLGACSGSSGLSDIATASISEPQNTGPSIATTLNNGQAVSAQFLTTGASLTNASPTLSLSEAIGSFSSNGNGTQQFGVSGSDINAPYASTTLQPSDAVSYSQDSWRQAWTSSSGTKYTMDLWNAGKGHREGLTQDEVGQTYHKILGYYINSENNNGALVQKQMRGHAIIGVATPDGALAARTRTATYDGYFFAHSMDKNGGSLTSPTQVRGGMQLKADFDANTISGRSTSFETQQGTGASVTQNKTITLNQTAIGSGGEAALYRGKITSDFAPLNGGDYAGRFFGPNAEETAGIISGDDGSAVAEGYFTAAETP